MKTLKNKFVGNRICVYQWVTMRNVENDKNHTVEHIRWVSYTDKNIRWKRDLCISMSSYNEKNWKANSLETGFVYINELQWETWKMIKTTLYNILDEWVTLKNTFVGNGICVYQWVVTMRNTEKQIRWKQNLCLSMSYNEKHGKW